MTGASASSDGAAKQTAAPVSTAAAACCPLTEICATGTPFVVLNDSGIAFASQHGVSGLASFGDDMGAAGRAVEIEDAASQQVTAQQSVDRFAQEFAQASGLPAQQSTGT